MGGKTELQRMDGLSNLIWASRKNTGVWKNKEGNLFDTKIEFRFGIKSSQVIKGSWIIDIVGLEVWRKGNLHVNTLLLKFVIDNTFLQTLGIDSHRQAQNYTLL